MFPHFLSHFVGNVNAAWWNTIQRPQGPNLTEGVQIIVWALSVKTPKWLSFVISGAAWTVPFNFTSKSDPTKGTTPPPSLAFLNHPLHANRLITPLTPDRPQNRSHFVVADSSPSIPRKTWQPYLVSRYPRPGSDNRLIKIRASPGTRESPRNRNHFQKFHLQFKSVLRKVSEEILHV